MANFEKDEFLFPDEIDEKKQPVDQEPEIEIEIVDDTPEEDRKNSTPMPKEIVDELEQDDLEAYSGDAKQKLLQLKKVWNDERRAKEAALREQQEALRVAQQLVDENKKLKGRVPWNKGKTGVQIYTDETKKKMSESHKGKKLIFTDEHKMNIGKASKGRVPWNKGLKLKNG